MQAMIATILDNEVRLQGSAPPSSEAVRRRKQEIRNQLRAAVREEQKETDNART